MANRENGSLHAAGSAVTTASPSTMRDWTSSPATPQDRSALRLATAERVIAEAFADSRRAVDRDTIDAAFIAARDCLAEARELSRQAHAELALARRERAQAQRDRELDRQGRFRAEQGLSARSSLTPLARSSAPTPTVPRLTRS